MHRHHAAINDAISTRSPPGGRRLLVDLDLSQLGSGEGFYAAGRQLAQGSQVPYDLTSSSASPSLSSPSLSPPRTLIYLLHTHIPPSPLSNSPSALIHTRIPPSPLFSLTSCTHTSLFLPS